MGHFKHFELSPRGVHVWRQCNTLAFAKNFYEEDMNILHPRVDHRKSSSGVTGSAFPLYEYGVALSYNLFGFHHINHRIIQFLIFFIGVIGIYFLCNILCSNSLASVMAAAFYAWSPELYYHGINALPDVLAMTASIWALLFYFKSKKDGLLYFILCFVLIAIAGLVKLQFLLFLIFILLDTLFDKDKIRAAAIIWFGALAGGIVVNWYIYSIKLRFASNLQDYGLFLNPADSISSGLKTLKNNFIIDLPEQIFGYGAIVLIVLGIISFHKNAKRNAVIKLWLIFSVFFVFHLLELKQMEHHAYYLMPYTILGALSIGYLYSRNDSKNTSLLFILALGIQIFHSLNKINPRFLDENSGLPTEFLDNNYLTQLHEELADSELAVVGPDPSGCIFFYYLDVEGWNAAGNDQLESKDDLKAAIDQEVIDHIVIRNLGSKYSEAYLQTYPNKTQIGEFVILSKN